MLITFHSTAAGSLMMFKADADKLLALLDKDISAAAGVLTVEQLPQAIEKLEQAIAVAKAGIGDNQAVDDADDEADDTEREKAFEVSFIQRAQPFVTFLRVSLAGDRAITWGV